MKAYSSPFNQIRQITDFLISSFDLLTFTVVLLLFGQQPTDDIDMKLLLTGFKSRLLLQSETAETETPITGSTSILCHPSITNPLYTYLPGK